MRPSPPSLYLPQEDGEGHTSDLTSKEGRIFSGGNGDVTGRRILGLEDRSSAWSSRSAPPAAEARTVEGATKPESCKDGPRRGGRSRKEQS